MNEPESPRPPYSMSLPDGDGFVWLCDANGHQCFNVGNEDQTIEMVTQWLGAIDHAERG